jgi:hypothetical protein
MINVKYDTGDLTKKIDNVVEYSLGFVEGIRMNRAIFNKELGKLASEMLKKYIDSKARMEKDSLHHVYEWGMSGNPGARLFEIDSKASSSNITFFGSFLTSNSISDTSEEPFFNKAEIMENAILIEVSPRNNVLSFETDGGENVFTADTIYIANPGGDAVAGSFGKTVEEFFDFHFTAQVLMQTGIMNKLSNPIEFSQSFAAGANGGGRSAGINAGRKYLTVRGVEFS